MVPSGSWISAPGSPTFGGGKSQERYYPKKKADVAEHPEVFDHVGLLVNEPSSAAGMLFI
jgi:hypothetical protein